MAKWKNVSTFAMASGFSHHVRNGPTCKDKWIIIYSDYCKVKDYMYTTGVNAYYGALSVQDRIALDLPHQYVREVYQIIEVFSSSWPIFSPPDSQDFMATKDGAYTLIGQEGSIE
jgi:hypothetical protein